MAKNEQTTQTQTRTGTNNNLSAYPKVLITSEGKAIAVEGANSKETTEFSSSTKKTKGETYTLFSFLCIIAVLSFCLFVFANRPMCKMISKPMLPTLKVQQITTLNQNGNEIVFIPAHSKTYNASLTAPLNFKEETTSADNPAYTKLKASDGTFCLILNIALKEEIPVELRTFHRLALENLMTEFGASISSAPLYFITEYGNKAFQTLLHDENHLYCITTAASDTAFATLIISSAINKKKEDNDSNTLILTAISHSLFIE